MTLEVSKEHFFSIKNNNKVSLTEKADNSIIELLNKELGFNFYDEDFVKKIWTNQIKIKYLNETIKVLCYITQQFKNNIRYFVFNVYQTI